MASTIYVYSLKMMYDSWTILGGTHESKFTVDEWIRACGYESSAQELADELTQAGIPVEDVIAMDNGIKKIYTGKIVEITKHPDADKLQVCQVECLTEEGEPVTKQIVTAATNVAVGQIVPVAYHNLA